MGRVGSEAFEHDLAASCAPLDELVSYTSEKIDEIRSRA